MSCQSLAAPCLCACLPHYPFFTQPVLSAFVWGRDSTHCGTIWARRRRRGSQRAYHQLDGKSAESGRLGEGQGEEHEPFLQGNQCCNTTATCARAKHRV